MNASSQAPSLSEVADQAGMLGAGLGILTIPLFPFALPALVLVVGPLLPLAVAGALLAGVFALPLWLVRKVLRMRVHRRGAAGSRGSAPSRPITRSPAV
jgi:Flp pilus assembly protein TadB